MALKKELEQQLETTEIERDRVQQAYKTALEREKDLCIEIEQAKVDRHSALKAKEAAEKALEEALIQASEMVENDGLIREVAQTKVSLDAVERKLAAKEKELEKLNSHLEGSENDNAALLRQISRHNPQPVKRILSLCAAVVLIFCFAVAGSVYLEFVPTIKEAVVGQVGKYIPALASKEKFNPLAGVVFQKTSHEVDLIGSYNMPTSEVRDPIYHWVKENGYDSVLFGTIRKWGGEEVLDTGANHVPLKLIIKEMRNRGNKRSVSLAKNPDNITLPSPFRKTSRGDIQFWQTQKKYAAFIPAFWSKAKQINFQSENFSGTIYKGKAKIKTGKPSLEEMYPIEGPTMPH